MNTEIIDISENSYLKAYYADEYRVDKETKSRPAVIICPGGGWFSLSEREGEPVALNFVQKGFHAFVLHYTIDRVNVCRTEISDSKKDINFSATGDRDVVSLALKDLETAVDYVKNHSGIMNSEEGETDNGFISLLGFSAGGQLAALYASNHFDISALILCYAVLDYDDVASFYYSGKCSLVSQEILDRVFNIVPLKDSSNPINNISDNMPKIFIWHSTLDNLIPATGSLNYALKLSEKNMDYELHLYDHGGHGLSLGTSSTAAVESEVDNHCAQWFDTMLKWLDMVMSE